MGADRNSSLPRRRRRLTRFSLRTLLIVLTLTSIWLGTRVTVARKQNRASAALERMRAEVTYEKNGQTRVVFGATEPSSPTIIEELRASVFPERVVRVRLYASWNSGAAKKGDEIMKCLGALPHLRSLSFSGVSIANEDLRHLSNHKQLATMYLESSKLDEQNVDFLRDLPLEWLCVARTRFADKSLASLRDMHTLEYLDVTRTKVSDAGLAYLEGLPNLKVIILRRTLVTREGYQALQKKLPNSRISWEPLVLPTR